MAVLLAQYMSLKNYKQNPDLFDVEDYKCESSTFPTFKGMTYLSTSGFEDSFHIDKLAYT